MLARCHEDRPHLDARTIHLHQQECDALLRLAGIVRSHQAENPVGFGGMGRPDFRSVEDQVVPIHHCRHLQRGEVRSRPRLRITLAEEYLARQDAGQEMGLLRGRAEPDDDMGDHVDTHGRQGWRPRRNPFPIEDIMLPHGPVATAMFDRPVRRRPAAFVQDALPGHAGFMIGIDAGGKLSRPPDFRCQPVRQEGAHLIAKGQFFLRPFYVHAHPHATNMLSETSPASRRAMIFSASPMMRSTSSRTLGISWISPCTMPAVQMP